MFLSSIYQFVINRLTQPNQNLFHPKSESVMYMSDTLRDVLNIQKAEEGILELIFQEFLIDDVIKNAFSAYKPLINDKRMLISLQFSGEIPHKVWGDMLRVEHVLGNLLSNAIKFSEKGADVAVTVTMNDGCVRFTVKDFGPGISEEDQKNLFVPYVTLRPGELKPGRGAGVGLALCKEIVELHGGYVGCISSCSDKLGPRPQAGRTGSEFFFQIPFEEVEMSHNSENISTRSHIIQEFLKDCGFNSQIAVLITPDETRPPLISQSLISTETEIVSSHETKCDEQTVSQKISTTFLCPTKDTLRFLLVDDVSSNRKMLHMVLKKRCGEGARFEMAVDGLDAVEKFNSNPGLYGIIFLDNMMPNMNGVETIRHLRQNLGFDGVGHPHPPTILPTLCVNIFVPHIGFDWLPLQYFE